jgi:hypothetical protein
MDFKSVLNKIETNLLNHQQGYYNCLPFIGMERLEKYLPGVEQATNVAITAGTGVGKSKLCRFLYIHSPIMYVENNPQLNIELDILNFSLEESEEKIILSEISKYLHTKYNLNIGVKELISIGKYNTITPQTLEKIKEAEEYVNKFLNRVHIFTDIRNATGIYKKVRDFALTIGTYYDVNGNPLSQQEIENVVNNCGDDYQKISYYKTYNPKHYVIIIIDHLSLLQPESGEDLRNTMIKMSSKYGLRFRDKFGFTTVFVQQQAMDKENIEVNYQGKTIEEKLEPSTNGLGDSKTVSRDYNVILGLFSPEKYKIPIHNGYDIKKLKDNYRSLSILKDRDGISNKKIPLFFNGATNFFAELPLPNDNVNLNKVYNLVEKINGK